VLGGCNSSHRYPLPAAHVQLRSATRKSSRVYGGRTSTRTVSNSGILGAATFSASPRRPYHRADQRLSTPTRRRTRRAPTRRGDRMAARSPHRRPRRLSSKQPLPRPLRCLSTTFRSTIGQGLGNEPRPTSIVNVRGIRESRPRPRRQQFRASERSDRAGPAPNAEAESGSRYSRRGLPLGGGWAPCVSRTRRVEHLAGRADRRTPRRRGQVDKTDATRWAEVDPMPRRNAHVFAPDYDNRRCHASTTKMSR